MFLGIDTDTGHIYEGAGAPQFAVFPRPAISLAKLIDAPEDWNSLPMEISHTPFPWVFREDSFDPVTRMRRGRLYETYNNTQPQECPVSAHLFDHDGVREVAASRQLRKRLYTYWPCQTLTARPDRGNGVMLALGTGRAATGWRVIQVETLIDRCVMVTLKAVSAFGILPEINTSKIEPGHQKSVAQAIDRVLDSAFRETPISVIDHCRNAAQVILSRWMAQETGKAEVLGKDLDQVCKAVQNMDPPRSAARDAANIVRLLHSRGKANKQESEGLRLSVEEDAEMSIQALAFILREIDWAVA
jgi:hypothetical protein